MKNRLLLLLAITMALLVCIATSCKKEDEPIIAGNYYNMIMGKSDKHWHPVNPVYVKDIYFNPASGTNFCHCLAKYFRDKGYPILAPGYTFNAAPDSILIWQLPINDLK